MCGLKVAEYIVREWTPIERTFEELFSKTR